MKVRENKASPAINWTHEDLINMMKGLYPNYSSDLIKTEVEWELQSRKSRKEFTEQILDGLFEDWRETIHAIIERMLVKWLDRPEYDWMPFARKLCVKEANLKGWEGVAMTMVSIAITSASGRNNTVPTQTIYGVVSDLMDCNEELTQFFIESFIEDEENPFLDAIENPYNPGEYRMVSKVELEPKDIEEYKSLRGKKPMLLPPQYPNKYSEGRPIAGTPPASKGLPVNPHSRWDVLFRIGQTRFYWNEPVMEDFEFIYKKNFRKEPNENWGASYRSWEESLNRAISVYEEMKSMDYLDNPMFFPAKPDGRERDYYDCSYINPQETEYKKAMLRFYKRKLTKKGLEMLYLAIANALNPKVDGKSLDKHPISFRISYVKKMSLKEMYDMVSTTHMDNRYPEIYQEQYSCEEPAKAFSLIHTLKKVLAGNLITGESIALDGVCQGMALWALGTEDPTLAKYTCLTSVNERYDFYEYIAEKLGIPRTPVKDALKVFMYGGSSGARKVLDPYGEEVYDQMCGILDTFPVFQVIGQIAKFWDSGWDAIRYWLPDCSRTQIWPKYKEINPETGEEEEGEWFQAEFFGTPVAWKVKTYGYLEKSTSLAAHINHSTDAYIQGENVRKCMFNPAQAQLLKKIRDYRNFMRSSFISEDLKNFAFSHKPFNPKSQKNHDLMMCLYRGAQIGWYSFRILDLIDETNHEMVPDEVLDYLYYELPEKPLEVGVIHDSMLCHVNDGWEMHTQYCRTMFHFANSDWYNEIFRQLGCKVRMPRRNPRLNVRLLSSPNFFS